MNTVESYYDIKAKLKRTTLKELENIDLGTLLSNDLAIYLSFGIKPFAFIKMLVSTVIDNRTYKLTDINNGDIIAFKSYEYSTRLDYSEMLERLKNIVPNLRVWQADNCVKKSKNCIKNLVLLMNWNSQLKSVVKDGKLRYFLLKRLMVCYQFYISLKEKKDQIKKAACVILHFDALDNENLLSQLCKTFNIPTATLQHGFFHRTKYINEKNFYIATPFEGFTSDYFLAWGEYTRQEAIANGIPDEQILLVGSLKTKRIEQRHPEVGIFALILNGDYEYNENYYLVQYAEKLYDKYGFKFIIRPHPSRTVEKSWLMLDGCYSVSNSKVETVYELANRVDFCMVGNSTVLSELVFMKIPAVSLRPSSGLDIYAGVKGVSFSCEKELFNIIDSFHNDKSIDVLLEYNKQLLFSSDNTEKSYKVAIDHIVKGKKDE